MLTELSAALIPGDADLVDIGLPVDDPAISLTRRVYIMPVTEYAPVPVFVGSTQIRREEYVIPLWLEVLNYSGNVLTGRQDTLAMAQALIAAIEGVCLADPSWGGAVMQSGLSLAGESTAPIAAQAGGWGSHVILDLHMMRQGA